MGFQTGLSGLNASSRNLDVIGNNIANANTTGNKATRAEFSDIVASSLGFSGGNVPGIGVNVAALAQQFTQGNITTTGNTLDVAINGNGFLQLTQPDGSTAYTRDGALKMDKDGFLRNNGGAFVMGYPTDSITGTATSVSLQKLQLPTAAPLAAKATAAVTAELNLDARAPIAASATPPTPRSTYGTSINIYDAQGVASPVNMYFEKTAANTWAVYPDLTTATPLGTLNFDTTGALTGPAIAGGANTGKIGFSLTAPTVIASTNPNDADKFFDGPLDVVFTGTTQFGSGFAVSNLTQDGYTTGQLTGVSIAETGVVTARYSNGQTQYSGQVTLADFRNPQGLQPLGGNAWAATYNSGAPVQGTPGSGKMGALRSGALEESNVDLTAELVNMMTAQRAYQANAQTIKTQDQVMSTLVNMR